MWIHFLAGRSSAALILASLVLFASSARAQAQQSPPTRLESEVTEMRAENGVIREQLRKLEEQQKTILQLMTSCSGSLTDGLPRSHSNRLLHPSPSPCRWRRRNPPLRQHNLPQIETLLRRIPTKTVSFW